MSLGLLKELDSCLASAIHLAPQVLALQVIFTMPSFLCGFWNQTQVLHSCIASILPAEPSPQSHINTMIIL